MINRPKRCAVAPRLTLFCLLDACANTRDGTSAMLAPSDMHRVAEVALVLGRGELSVLGLAGGFVAALQARAEQ
jgi:hypothetical protein